MSEAIDETLKEMRIEHEAASDAIGAALKSIAGRRDAVATAEGEDEDLASEFPSLVPLVSEVEALFEQVERRIKTLHEGANDRTSKNMNAEAQELRARKVLGLDQQAVVEDIERRKQYACLPAPAELKTDIDALVSWAAAIRNRRKTA